MKENEKNNELKITVAKVQHILEWTKTQIKNIGWKKTFNGINDKIILQIYWITIKYKTRKNGKVIYRSRFAETDWSEKKEIKYLKLVCI